MADAVLVDVAQAVEDTINSATDWPIRGTSAVWSWGDWDEDLPDMDVLHLDVVPYELGELRNEIRSKFAYSAVCDVWLRKKFGQDSQTGSTGRVARAEVGKLVYQLQQIAEWWLGRRLEPSGVNAIATGVEIVQWYDREELKALRQYTGIVRATHRVLRAST